MSWPLAPAAKAALAGSHVVAMLAEVTDPNGNVLATLDVTAGQVVEDETAGRRRTCTVTLQSLDLVPSQIGDLLHPLTGNELRLYRGVTLPGVPASTAPGGTLAPLGVFRMSAPQSTDTDDQLDLTLTGYDRSSAISAAQWTSVYPLTAGVDVSAAIRAIIASRWTGPALTFNFPATGVLVPAGQVLGVQFTSTGVTNSSGSTSGANDPWADCVKLASSAGCEVLFDRVGIPTLRPVPQPSSQVVSSEFVEGETCTMTALQRTLDETSFRNGVIATGLGAQVTASDGTVSPGPAVYAEAWSTDPVLGPTGVLGARPDWVTDNTAATTPEIQAVANARLLLVEATLDDTAFTAVCDPTIDAGDTVTLTRTRMKVSANYVPSAVTIPFDESSLMQVTNRPYAVATT